ncbi:BACON domain-containing protein [Prevotella melaninogenica]|uniref:Chitobiase n=1 Tax=Prevotella melaninogenica DNF00666 TaxID=1401073 RepID=A0A096APL2_9BACT|nr:BACON domain-containing protein [Prevotella melaninogenica]KGF49013.1 chitobiase [Prevotella melaninogenica DNF00666]
MKLKINFLFILSVMFAGALGLASCAADYDTDFTGKELEVPHSSQRMIAFNKEGGEQQIVVDTNVPLDEWKAETNADWLTVTKNADGKGVTVKAPSYDGFKAREAKVTISYGERASYKIKVSQMGYESVLRIPEQNPFFNREGTFYSLLEGKVTSIEVPVETNLNLDNIIVPDTVSFVHLDASKTVKENGIVKLHFDMDPNTTSEKRYCTVRLKSSDNWDASIEYVIEQAAKGYKVRPIYPVETKQASVEMIDLGRTYRVPFQRAASDGNYEIIIPEDAKDWLSTTKKFISGSEVVFTATLNTTDNARSCDVVCKPSNSSVQPFTIHVTQQPFQDIVPTGVSDVNVTPDKGQFNVTWKAPDEVNYEKVIVRAKSNMPGVPESVKEVAATETSCVLNDVFNFAGNYTITVTTQGLRGKNTDAPATATAQANEWSEAVEIPLTASMVSSNSMQAGHEIGSAVDGNKTTYFQTKSNGSTSAPRPYIDITLNEGINGTFYLAFDENKVTTNNRNPKRANIYASADVITAATPVATYVTYRSANAVSEPLSYTKTNGATITHIRFEPTERKNGTKINNGGGSAYWYLAELHLYVYHDEAWKKKQLGF